jgi:uncharacterized RDD family membrane protein YckC
MTGEAAMAGRIDTATTDETATGNRYAGFWRRLAAGLIDGLIVSIVCAIALLGLDLALAVGAGDEGSAGVDTYLVGMMWLLATITLGWVAAKAGLECSSARATPGKRALGIAVCDIEGRRMSFRASLWRNWTLWLPAALFWGGLALMGAMGMLYDAGGVGDNAVANGMEVTGALHALAALAGAAAVVACLAVAFTAHKQGLHDRMARAYVIRN